MPKYMLLFVFPYFAVIGFTQEFPLYHDSLRNDAYMLQVDQKLDSIKALLQSEQVRFDTLKLKVRYTIRKSNGSFILQNPYSIDRFPAKKKTFRTSVCVASHEGAILGIALHKSCFHRDSTWLMTPGNLHVNISPVLYFDRDTLLYSFHGNRDPNQYVGSCGGAASDYANYFMNGEYYSTVISTEMYCGCGYNFIMADETIIKVREKLQEKLSED